MKMTDPLAQSPIIVESIQETVSKFICYGNFYGLCTFVDLNKFAWAKKAKIRNKIIIWQLKFCLLIYDAGNWNVNFRVINLYFRTNDTDNCIWTIILCGIWTNNIWRHKSNATITTIVDWKFFFKIIFGTYLLVSVVVLINLLIAMMSDTYQRIQV
jgi:hypothetical protein